MELGKYQRFNGSKFASLLRCQINTELTYKYKKSRNERILSRVMSGNTRQ